MRLVEERLVLFAHVSYAFITRAFAGPYEVGGFVAGNTAVEVVAAMELLVVM